MKWSNHNFYNWVLVTTDMNHVNRNEKCSISISNIQDPMNTYYLANNRNFRN